jgi:hypothetical protein
MTVNRGECRVKNAVKGGVCFLVGTTQGCQRRVAGGEESAVLVGVLVGHVA